MSDSLWNRYNKYAKNHKEIVPSDTVDFSTPCVVVAQTDGTVSLVDYNGNEVVWNVIAGQTIPVVARRINSTLTTAELIGIF